MQIKKKIFFSFFGPVWEIDQAQKFFKFFEFFQLKSKTRINFRNYPKKSKKNTKNCDKDKKLKVARALCAPPRGNRVKWCHIRLINPQNTNPGRMKKLDKTLLIL